MQLSSLDFLLWTAGFSANASLTVVLWYRRRAHRFPMFTALISLNVLRTIVLYLVLRYSSRALYASCYWALLLLDTTLQLAVVVEVAGKVFRPVDFWAQDLRKSILSLMFISTAIAFGLAWLAEPASATRTREMTARGNLFAAILLSELFVAMMALSIHSGIPWRTHAAKVAQGLGVYSLITVFIETGHNLFGAGSTLPGAQGLSEARKLAYLGCVAYWIHHLWREESPMHKMTEEMRQKLFALQELVDYHLRDLESREK